MTGKYYTTAEIKTLFGWSSDNTVTVKRNTGFLPPPDLMGRPNKWLKTKIDALMNDSHTPKEDDA